MLDKARRTLLQPDLWIPLLVAAPLLWALLPGGLPNSADGPVHLVRSMEMIHAWQDGVWVPRWSENLGYGYGLPLFVYAPPLPYYLTAFFYTLGLPLEMAYKAMTAVGVLVGGYGAYWLARSSLARWAGAVAAAALLYAPIGLRELFIQGNVAQYLAWTFAPWAAWAVVGLYGGGRGERLKSSLRGDGRGRYAVVLALALVGTLLCHNAVALIVMGMVGGLAVVLLLFTRDWRAFAWAMGGIALGLALAAWFWVPALLEGKYVALHYIVASDFRPRFIALRELLMLSPRLDTGAINPYFPLTLGAVQLALAALGVCCLALFWLRGVISTVDKGAGTYFALLALSCGFMATAWSEPVWAALPFVDLFEWPFRWHSATALALAYLCGWAMRPWRGAWATAAGVTAVLLILGSALVNLYPQKLPYLGRVVTPQEVARFETRTGAVGTTSLGEFNPVWVEGSLKASPLVESYLAGGEVDRLPALPPGASGEQVASSVHRQEFALRLSEPATVTLNLMYFPGWRADAGGQEVTPRPEPGSGLMMLALPAGEYRLALTFAPTPLRRVVEWVSPLVWLGLAIVGIGGWVARRGSRQSGVGSRESHPEGSRGSRGETVVLPLAVCVALVLALRAIGPEWFRLHSPPDTALGAQTTLRADFGGKVRLLGVDLPPETAAPGESVTVVAYWRALEPLDEEYSVFLHLDDEWGSSGRGETVATVDQLHPSEIPTSGWATGLHVRNPLRLRVPADALPIRYALRVGMYGEDGLLGEPATVGHLWVEAEDAPQPPDGPAARFGESLHLLGADVDGERGEVTLYWRADAPYPAADTIFVHLFDGQGKRIGQMDGAPFGGRYPLPAWRVGEVIEDRRALPVGVDGAAVERVAVGVYDPASGERRAAFDAEGAPLADNMLVIEP